MALVQIFVLVGVVCSVGGVRQKAQALETEDCAWAKIDPALGLSCQTIRTFGGGMQGNTALVEITRANGDGPYLLVLKEMNSNQNPDGLNSLENELDIARKLTNSGFSKMPAYYFDITVDPKYQKWVNQASMTPADKIRCNDRGGPNCVLNPAFDACNGHRGAYNTTTELLARERRKKTLACPDSQILAMEFLDGWADLPHLHQSESFLRETGLEREVRAAALFVAYDEMNSLGFSHCDFNTGNAMFNIANPAQASIIDFGLARSSESVAGMCNGKIEDITRPGMSGPGFLWLALYRGHRNENDWANNDKKAGPLSLSRGATFQTPAGLMKPFSALKGSGGDFNKETRQNWPEIIAYAHELLSFAGSQGGGSQQPDNKFPGIDVLGESPEQPVRPAMQPGKRPNEEPSKPSGPDHEPFPVHKQPRLEPQTIEIAPSQSSDGPKCAVKPTKDKRAKSGHICKLSNQDPSHKACYAKLACGEDGDEQIEVKLDAGYDLTSVKGCYMCQPL